MKCEAKVFFLISLLTLCFQVPSSSAEISAETRWADPSSVVLDVEFPGDGYHANWEMFRCDCGDLLVRSELNVPGEVEKGETLLVQGRAMLSRGFGAHKAELGASLDAPALMMQLALSLLERTEPGGPGKIGEAVEFDMLEELHPIHLETGGAVGEFQAPWSVKAKLSSINESRKRFDLRFTFSVGEAEENLNASMRLSGAAEYAETEFPVSGSSGLGSWEIAWRDEVDAAIGKTESAATLDELRELIREN